MFFEKHSVMRCVMFHYEFVSTCCFRERRAITESISYKESGREKTVFTINGREKFIVQDWQVI